MYSEHVALVVDAASSELSWHAAQLLSSAGMYLALHDSGEADILSHRVATLHSEGNEALAILAELEVPKQLDALLERVLATWGRLDMLVLPPLRSAAHSIHEQFLDAPADSVRASLQALRASLNIQRATARHMAQREGGQIIAVTDVTQAAPYTQAAANAFADSLRAETAAFGVTVRRLSLAQLGLELLAQPVDTASETEVAAAQDIPAKKPKLRLAEKLLPRGNTAPRSATVLTERLNKDLLTKDLADDGFSKDLSPST